MHAFSTFIDFESCFFLSSHHRRQTLAVGEASRVDPGSGETLPSPRTQQALLFKQTHTSTTTTTEGLIQVLVHQPDVPIVPPPRTTVSPVHPESSTRSPSLHVSPLHPSPHHLCRHHHRLLLPFSPPHNQTHTTQTHAPRHSRHSLSVSSLFKRRTHGHRQSVPHH